jgi:hypothetical protein
MWSLSNDHKALFYGGLRGHFILLRGIVNCWGEGSLLFERNMVGSSR